MCVKGKPKERGEKRQIDLSMPRGFLNLVKGNHLHFHMHISVGSCLSFDMFQQAFVSSLEVLVGEFHVVLFNFESTGLNTNNFAKAICKNRSGITFII